MQRAPISAPTAGFAYGAHIGYDRRVFENAVLGVEVDVTGKSGDGVSTGSGLKAGRSIAATARVGYLTDPQGLVYARGGYRNAKFSFVDFFGSRSSFTRDGYTLGAGYERYVSPKVSARVEYAYTGLGEDSRFSNNQVQTIDNKRHNVTAGINFRF